MVGSLSLELRGEIWAGDNSGIISVSAAFKIITLHKVITGE